MRLSILCLCIFAVLIASAQDTTLQVRVARQSADPPPVSQTVYAVVEHMPEFPGGEGSMRKFIKENLIYPDSARSNNVQGRVVVGFVVNDEGSLSGISLKKGVSKELDAEALRLVKSFPKFQPGMQDGKPVRVSFILPIQFNLRD